LPPSTRPQSSWVILICTWLMGFALQSPMNCVPPMLHIITEELQLSYAQSGLIFSIAFLIVAAIAIPGGALADRIGIRKAAGIGMIVIIVGSFLRGTAIDFWTLLAFTCLYGAGIGLVLPNLPKLVRGWFPPQRVGLATGLYAAGIMSGIALSTAITLPVVFPITNTFRGVFYIWSIPAVVAAILWWIVVKEPTPGRRQSEPTSEVKRSSYRVWTNGALWLVAMLFFFVNYVNSSWLGWAPQWLMAKGAPPALAAFMTSVVSWVSLPLAFVVPWVSDRFGTRKHFLWPPFALIALVLVCFMYSSLALDWAIAVVFGLAAGAQLPLVLAFLPDLVPAEGVGRASGMAMSIGSLGGLFGPWLVGYIMDITGNVGLNLIILAALSVFCVFLALRLPETGAKAGLRLS
jgi:CP family cyanate transporter-like MFS transporter